MQVHTLKCRSNQKMRFTSKFRLLYRLFMYYYHTYTLLINRRPSFFFQNSDLGLFFKGVNIKNVLNWNGNQATVFFFPSRDLKMKNSEKISCRVVIHKLPVKESKIQSKSLLFGLIYIWVCELASSVRWSNGLCLLRTFFQNKSSS